MRPETAVVKLDILNHGVFRKLVHNRGGSTYMFLVGKKRYIRKTCFFQRWVHMSSDFCSHWMTGLLAGVGGTSGI